jgi:hypothetical protein
MVSGAGQLCEAPPARGLRATRSSQKTPEISPLFKVNPNVVLKVGWVRDGKLNVGFYDWDASKVVLARPLR